MHKKMFINGKEIGTNTPPYIIAEMSSNHLKDYSIAIQLIDAAVEAGADAVKIQTFTAESLTIDCDKPDFVINDALWKGKTYYQLYHDIAMPLDWTEPLFAYAKNKGITLFSSPFDSAGVDLLESVSCPAYKIASFEAQDEQLLKAVAATGKPIIISSGISNFDEISNSLTLLKQEGALEVAVLHCVSSYPAPVTAMHLKCLAKLQTLGTITGLSDHSRSNLASIMSIALGGTIIEKHLTLSRKLGGPDAAFSLEPNEFASLVRDSHSAWQALGSESILEEHQRQGAQHSRSIYAISDIPAGATFTNENIKIIRPGFGLSPSAMTAILGQTARVNIERGTALNWSMISNEPTQLVGET